MRLFGVALLLGLHVGSLAAAQGGHVSCWERAEGDDCTLSDGSWGRCLVSYCASKYESHATDMRGRKVGNTGYECTVCVGEEEYKEARGARFLGTWVVLPVFLIAFAAVLFWMADGGRR